MTEQAMLSKDAFIDFILNGLGQRRCLGAGSTCRIALPEGFEGFDKASARAAVSQPGSSFARRLLEASGFGYAEMVQRDNGHSEHDAVARLPAAHRASFWPRRRRASTRRCSSRRT